MRDLVAPKGLPLQPRQVEGLRLLGAQLRAARLGRGWSQRRLEWASGVDQTTISRLENGRLRSLRLTRIGDLMGALRGDWKMFPDETWPPESACTDARRPTYDHPSPCDAKNGIASRQE